MTRHIIMRVISVTAFILAVPSSIFAGTLVLDNLDTDFQPGIAVRYFVDETGTLTANDAYARRDQFRPIGEDSVQVRRDAALWILLDLENRTSQTEWIVANTMNVELMELYEREGTSWRFATASGNAIPFADRTLSTRLPAFPVSIPAGSKTEFFARTFDLQSSSIRLEVSESRRFWNSYRDQTFLLGLAFGFFCALIIYNAIVFLVNRDPTYLVYSLYMFAFALNQFAQERLLIEYIQPHRPHGFFWFVFFGGLTAALGIEFFRRLLETGRQMPGIDRTMRISQIALGAVVITGFFAAGPVIADILNILSLAAMALVVYTLLVRVLKRDMLALACLVGSFLYLAGTTAEIISVLLPIRVTSFVLHAQLYGALAQVLILAFALGTKTHQLQTEYNRVQRQFRSELEKRVRDRTQDLQLATFRLKEESVTDDLTGLYNRKELTQRSAEFDKLVERKSQTGDMYSVTVAYIDLDNFKQCNDSFGHGFGDEILRRTADVLRHHTRGYDLAFRVGGDEFVIIMPETSLDEARSLVERVQDGFAVAMPSQAPISISVGLASTNEAAAIPLTEAIEAADAALLASKASGKNRITTNPEAFASQTVGSAAGDRNDGKENNGKK